MTIQKNSKQYIVYVVSDGSDPRMKKLMENKELNVIETTQHKQGYIITRTLNLKGKFPEITMTDANINNFNFSNINAKL